MQVVEVMKFFMPMEPPTTTAQQKKINTKTKTIYANQKAAEAKKKYRAHLAVHAPSQPFDGPIALQVVWGFPIKASKYKNGDPYTNKPDLDNTNKMLQDILQEMGFIADDKNIVDLHLIKVWSDVPGVSISISVIS